MALLISAGGVPRTTACVTVLLTLPLASVRDGALPAMGYNTWCTGSACGQVCKQFVNNHSVCYLLRVTRLCIFIIISSSHRNKMHDVCHEDEAKGIATTMLQNGMHAGGYTYVNLGTTILHMYCTLVQSFIATRQSPSPRCVSLASTTNQSPQVTTLNREGW